MDWLPFLAKTMASRHRWRAGEAEVRLARKGKVAKPYLLAALGAQERPAEYLSGKLGRSHVRRGKVRFRAAYALCIMKHRDARLLKRLADDLDDDVSFDVRVAMGKTKNRQLAIFLAKEVANDGKFALASAMGLYEFGAVALREALALSYDKDPNVRYTANNLLEEIALPTAVKRIKELAQDQNEIVREAAEYSLQEIQAKADRRDRFCP